MKQAFDKDDASQRQDRLLTTLEGLLELPATEVKATLESSNVPDCRRYSPPTRWMSSSMTRRPRRLWLLGPAIPRWAGGSAPSGWTDCPSPTVDAPSRSFSPGAPFLTGHADQDPEVLVGLKEPGLGVKSEIAAGLRGGGRCVGECC